MIDTALRSTSQPTVQRHRIAELRVAAVEPRRLAALRVPLAVKLVGASALTLLVFASAWLYFDPGVSRSVVFGLLVLLLGVFLALALIALRPVRDLERVAEQVWHGDYAARFRDTAVADDEVLRVGTMFNRLLDGLTEDRARMRALAEEVVAVGDRERAALARQLHDSTAQRLAALLLQISAVARDARDPELAARLAELRNAAETLTEDVRLLASSVHPRVLDDLGIVPAVKKMARDTTRTTGMAVEVVTPDSIDLPQPIAAALYRVAQESVQNAAAHSGASSIRITIQRGDGIVAIEVVDDGTGFDVDDALRRRPGMGLFTMRERVSLVDGTFEMRSNAQGTIVAAAIPLAMILTKGDKR